MTVIKVQRLEWCGHVVGMDGDRTVSMLVEGKPGGGGRETEREKRRHRRSGWMMLK